MMTKMNRKINNKIICKSSIQGMGSSYLYSTVQGPSTPVVVGACSFQALVNNPDLYISPEMGPEKGK